MEDSENVNVSPRVSLDPRINSTRGKLPISCLVVAPPKCFSQNTLNCITSFKKGIKGNKSAGDLGLFLLTTAVLETVRRLSKSKCPIVWQGLQALQLLCYPPLRWIQKWAPFKGLAKLQTLSAPMLVLSIATLFSEQPTYKKRTRKILSDSGEYSDLRSDTTSELAVLDRSSVDIVPKDLVPEKWMLELREDLHKCGISLPERFNEDELVRFYGASNFEYSKFVGAVKKTILWRQNYNFLSLRELESWSDWIFWHGCDTMQRPCLIIRLGLACSSLNSNRRPFLATVVVSQIEQMIGKLVVNSQIMVLMDCEGLPPLGFPIHMMRSCATLLQDHYPRRLGCLMIIRLPVLARFISKALYGVLKPATRKKLMVLMGNFEEVLSEHLQPLPVFLGGNCSCSKCLGLNEEDNANFMSSQIDNETRVIDSTSMPTDSTTLVEIDSDSLSRNAMTVVSSPDFDISGGKKEELIRLWTTVIIAILLCVFAFIFRKQ
jgi:hypothetical protein